jgi:hypothetical protein
MSDRAPCGGCALSAGACANLEPYNQLRARIAVRAGLPFYCHATPLASWKDPIAFKVAILRHERIPICQGWVREVRALASTGYYTTPARQLQKDLGATALRAIETFVNTDEAVDPYGKANAREDLDTAISILFADDPTP